MRSKSMLAFAPFLMFILTAQLGFAASPVEEISKAHIPGGILVQVGSDELALKALGERFHVRMLLADGNSVEEAQAAIDKQQLQGQFTVSTWNGKTLPFADRSLNALIVAKDGLVEQSEAMRALIPRGLLISPSGVKTAPVPDTIDDWTHFLYNASGNAVSKDKEVASPKSRRWWAKPIYAISHHAPASLLGMVSSNGRIFYLVNETSYLFERTGIVPERWFLVARDAFNGALLWKKPLRSFGQNTMEEVGQQPGPGVWRTPMNLNRRLVAQGDRIYATIGYDDGPLSIIDAATGKILRDIDLGGVIDEIVADPKRVVCRVRREIPKPIRKFLPDRVKQQELKKQGIKDPMQFAQEQFLDTLKNESGQEIVAFDPASGKILWRHPAKAATHRSMAMADGKLVYHNYEVLVALDAATGDLVWEFPTPWEGVGNLAYWRAYFGDLLLAEGKVYWASHKTGGYVLNLADGTLLWKDPRMIVIKGFTHPLGVRVIDGTLYWDNFGARSLADGSRSPKPDLGGMLSRGHHTRCYPGKATERFLILPQRGAEFVDLQGDEHMVNDWLRGSCSYGLMPANGLLYNTPDPCSCYAGARVPGLMALAAKLPTGLAQAPEPSDPERLIKGPAYTSALRTSHPALAEGDTWPIYMANPMRTSMAATPLSSQLAAVWTADIGGDLTQATIAAGKAFIVRKDRYDLLCLNLADGKTLWTRSFPAVLDGPPTIVGPDLFIGCRDGRVYALAADNGDFVWSRLVAPIESLTLGDDRLENTWPVFSSVLHHNGLIYAVAGNNSYLDGGVHLVALEPATGELRHHTLLEGPWPDKETLRTPVIRGDNFWRQKTEERKDFDKVNEQYATGYHVPGGQADLLVTDAEGKNLYMSQNKFDAQLSSIPLKRVWHTGYTPMGGMHILANFGLLDDSMWQRTSRMFNDGWPSYGTGPGSAARAGSLVVIGQDRAYAAQHWSGGGYATRKPGSGNRIVADSFTIENLPGDLVAAEFPKAKFQKGQKAFSRIAEALWEVPTPIIIRSLLATPDGKDGELIFAAGIVEGNTVEEWNKSIYFEGPGKLQVFNGTEGQLLAEYDLPACPVFDGMSAAGGNLLVPMVNGQIVCLSVQSGVTP